MIYACCTENRRNRILAQIAAGQAAPNGVDYLEVLGGNTLGLAAQQYLFVHCLNDVRQLALASNNVLIEGGASITDIQVVSVTPAASVPAASALGRLVSQFADINQVLVIYVNQPGDFSTYRLRLVNSALQAAQDPFEVTSVLNGFDPQLAAVEFSFKVECGLNFDCAPPATNCPPATPPPPPINYLAKDYASFRSILLDRLNQLLPQWGGSSEADVGVTLAELLAYVGDHLSYQQDAIGTEAYLETARSRISLRRHARLVDYRVHDGGNARAWIQLRVAGNPGAGVLLDHSQFPRFFTRAPGGPAIITADPGSERAALLSGVVVFEALQSAMLYPEHNQISFYTWSETNCCLPKGATEATLLGTLPNLQPGDVLIFQELLGPQTGDPADADVRHRCAVRLTQVTTLTDTLPATPVPVTEIQWAEDDALPFPICLSSTFMDSEEQTQTLTGVSVAFGNVILADHGLTLSGITVGTVPAPRLFLPPDPSADHCQPPSLPTGIPVRFRPQIPDRPLTQAAALPVAGAPTTPGIVALDSESSINLADADGLVSLAVQTTAPSQWPQYIGVVAAANGGNFDLAVKYLPTNIVLEEFTNLSTQPGLRYVATQINGVSNFIQVPSSYVPPTTPPGTFSTQPTALPNTGSVTVQDAAHNPFLTLQATPPANWPLSFGIVAQPTQLDPPQFNLSIVYNPPAGAVGVTLPVVVEQFGGLTLDTAAGVNSKLVTVQSFADTPDLSLSASDLMNPDPSTCTPSISLVGSLNGASQTWSPEPDLLASGPADPDFVVEVEADGSAYLRFGDNLNGEMPATGTFFEATYRIGNGTAGNVGADSLCLMTVADARIQACRNPLPAIGGTDPETNDQIRRRAPQAFLTQERAVTMADYAALAEANPQVDRAVASLRWTGSWYTVFVAVEPQNGGNLASALAHTLRQNLDRYRLAGQDLELDSPQYVSLEIDLQICVDPGYFDSDVEQSVLQVLGNSLLPNGQKGFFYPTNFTFGQTVYLSMIYAAVRSVAGVNAVTAQKFQVQGVDSPVYLATGAITLGPLQVARLDNDPNFPDHGKLTLFMEGGK